MSIMSSAYRLCKTVWKSPRLNEIREIIASLDQAPPDGPHSPGDRSHFGYIARQQQAQILGYLIVDQKRDKIEQMPPQWPIPPLREDERRLLAGVHKQIAQLNEQCIEVMEKQFTERPMVVDPYGSRFRYSHPPDAVEVELFDGQAAQALVNSFRNHPAIAALHSLSRIDRVIPIEDYMTAIKKLRGFFLQAGPLQPPDWGNQITSMYGKDTPERILSRHLVALLCIRESLATLDQLIYQAIRTDKLAVLDEDSVLGITGRHSHIGGRGMRVTYQQTEKADWLELFELVLVKCPSRSIDALCRVERFDYAESPEIGPTAKVGLREIDQDLNPYGPLIVHI